MAVTSPSWAVVVAEAAERAEVSLPSLQMKKLWLTGEGCSPSFRTRVERLWGTRANFFYGSLECGVLGIECDAHDGYHLAEAHAFLEVIDPRSGEPLPAGETGELVVTALLRYDSPVLRFRTGDLGALVTGACSCGVPFERLVVRGRASDQIGISGRYFSPIYLEELLMRMPEVGNWFELVVPASGAPAERGKVRVELSPGVSYSAGLEASLSERMSLATGVPFDVEITVGLPRPTTKAARVVRE
ncbi:MAG: hypothetical protein R3F14_09750 [Polyangiaceae bacterium]